MKVEEIKLSKLKPLETNVRRHSNKQIDELIRSVEQFGQTRAIVIDENNEILIGNGLYQALKKMGVETAQVIRKKGYTDIEKKKMVLSDNRIYSLGSDDYDGIEKFVSEITAAGDYDVAGFDAYTLEMLIIDDGDADDEINSYGTITDEKFQNGEMPTFGNMPETAQNSSRATEPEQTDKTSEEQNSRHSEAVRRSVVCPSCGEVIYID